VLFNRAHGNKEHRGDLTIGIALRGQRGDPALSLTKVIAGLVGGRAGTGSGRSRPNRTKSRIAPQNITKPPAKAGLTVTASGHGPSGHFIVESRPVS
jgi:hypothetical protein